MSPGNAARLDALYYGQGIGGVIFDSQNGRDVEGNSLLSAVCSGTSSLALVRVVLKWGVDINAVNNKCVIHRESNDPAAPGLESLSFRQVFGAAGWRGGRALASILTGWLVFPPPRV